MTYGLSNVFSVSPVLTLWLSEEDKDWHDPLLTTLREKRKQNWRTRSATGLEGRGQMKGLGRGSSRELPSAYGGTGQSSRGGPWSVRATWQAAASAWAASSWQGADDAAPITRERALGSAAEVQSGTWRPDTSYLLTFRLAGDSYGIPPMLLYQKVNGNHPRPFVILLRRMPLLMFCLLLLHALLL